MIPVLFKIGPVPVNAYGLLLVFGFFNAYLLIKKEYLRRGIPVDFASPTITIGLIAAIVGSRLFHVAEHSETYFGPNGDLLKILTGAGLTWYGGFVVAAAATIWEARRRGVHWTRMVDATAPAIAIGYGFGRLGCFLAGDGCYGLPCATLGLRWPAPFCMAFPKGAVPTHEPVLNTPLFEIAGAAALFAYLQWIRRRTTTPSWIFAQMVTIHALMRFAVEFVRDNPKLAWGLSQAQWISMFGVVIGVALFALGPRLRRAAPQPTTA